MSDLSQILLNIQPDESILDVLESISISNIDQHRFALFLLAILTESSTIKDKAEEIIDNLKLGTQYIEIQAECSVFSTVNECLVNESIAYDQIHDEFLQFHTFISKYVSLLKTNNVLVEQMVALGKKLHLFHGLTNEAESCFQLILDVNDTHAEATYSMGRIQELKLNIDRAFIMYEQVLKINPDHVFANLQIGVISYEEKEDFQCAINHLNKVVGLEPFRTETYAHLAKAYLGLGEIERSIQVLESGLAIHPHNEKALEVLGMIHWQYKNDIEKARAIFEKGLDHHLHGDSAILLFRLGELYQEELSDFDQATIYYEKAYADRPSDKLILYKLLELYIEHRQDTHRADELYHSFLLANEDVEVLIRYANFTKSFFNDISKSIDLVEKALSIDPKSEDAQLLFKTLKEDQDYQEILDLFEEDTSDDDDFIGGDALGDND